MNGFPMVTTITLFPAVMAVFLSFWSSRSSKKTAFLSAASVFISLAITLYVLVKYFLIGNLEVTVPEERLTWFPDIGSFYHLGIDGLSIWFVFMTLLAGFTGLVWSALKEQQPSRFYIFFLILISSCIGIFVAKDLFLLIFFWGLSILPLLLLIDVEQKRRQSSIFVKSFVYHFGSYLLLITSVILISVTASKFSGVFSFEMEKLSRITFPIIFQKWIFWLLFIGLSVRMSLFPFHGWLSDIVTETSGVVSAFILSVVLKTGIYMFVRVGILYCPDVVLKYQSLIMYVALITMIYGALIALVHPDMRKVILFSTMSFIGFALFSLIMLNNRGMNGSMMIAINHGFVVLILFLAIIFLKEHFGTVLIQDLGGVSSVFPGLAVLFYIASFAYIGFPGFGLFPGFFLAMSGIVLNQPIWALVSGFGLVIGAVSILATGQKIFRGMKTDLVAHYEVVDKKRNWLWGVPILILSIWIGITPGSMFKTVDPSMLFIQTTIKSHRILNELRQDEGWSPLQHFYNPHLQHRKKESDPIQ